VTIVAILTFFGASILALGALAFFFIAVVGMTGGDGGDPASVAIAGMGVAGGFSLLVLAGVAACLAVGVLKLREWARIVSIASIAVGIACTILSLFTILGFLVIPAGPMIVCHLLVMAAAVWMLVYLLRPGVKQAFSAVTRDPLSGSAWNRVSHRRSELT
jgi:predicted membrane channel-forming protein YqfA (hemolysin III family)